ncbi:hypothetical protein HMPREF1568_0672 [Providencia alcalifaciens PAL-3]|nr:hypothetical protein HMPREF1568_0672 [Providencia alcalifaciens PAL-3]EUD00978.1 hypothetical protein HMPREF1566_3261 [Providencia alcalifaciens PAL-1]
MYDVVSKMLSITIFLIFSLICPDIIGKLTKIFSSFKQQKSH